MIEDKVKICRGSQVILEIPINEGAKGVFSLKTSDYIILPFSLVKPVYFRMGDYVDLVGMYDGAAGALLAKRYEITEKQMPTYNASTGGYDYSLKLDAYYWKWRNKIFKYIPERKENEASWSLTATLDVHMGVFLRNLKALGYKYNGIDFQVSIDNTVENKAVSMTYDNMNLLDALFSMSSENAWNCDVWVTDNIIHFGRNEFGDAVKIERDIEAGNITRNDSKGTYATRIYAFGSTRNIPTNYRPSDEQVVVNGVVQKRLMLPSDTPYIDAYEEMTDDEAVEQVVVFDDVYPRRVGELSNVHTRTEEIKNEDGTRETVTYYRYKDTGFVFKDEYNLEGEKLKVKFESGKMNGLEFEVIFDPDHKGEQLWEIDRNKNYGRYLPDDVIRPQDGDEYVLSGFNIQLVSDQYISDAEKELKDKAEAYIGKVVNDDSTFHVPLRSSWVHDNVKFRFFEFGQRINLVDPTFFADGRQSRVLGWELKLDMPWDTPVYTVGESMPYSRIGEIEDKVDALTYKGNTYDIIGGSSIYIIRTNDVTPASNSNVFSALRVKNGYLSKENADSSPHSYTLGELNVRKGMESGESQSTGEMKVEGKARFELGIEALGESTVENLTSEKAQIRTIDAIEINSKDIISSSVSTDTLSVDGGSTTIGSGGIRTSLVSRLQDVHLGTYMEGLAGGAASGGLLTADGHGSLKSLSLSEYLSVPELRYNRVTVESGVRWNAPGAGRILDMSHDSEGYFFRLRLEEGEVGSFDLHDICMGVWHFTGDGSANATKEEEEADSNGLTVAGFATVYFTVTKVEDCELDGTGYANGKVYYRVRGNGYDLHPVANMAIVAYGNFYNKSRQQSIYETRTFRRLLYNVSTWDISPANVGMQTGDCSNIDLETRDGKVINLGGYSAYLDNVYFRGHIEQLDVKDLTDEDNLLAAKNYSVELSKETDVITIDEYGNIDGGLVTEEETDDGIVRHFRFSCAVTVRKNGVLLIDNEEGSPSAGRYRLTALAKGCECIISNSTLYITSVDGARKDEPLTDDELEAMRKLESCSVDLTVECEGEAVLQKTFVLSFKHTSTPVISEDGFWILDGIKTEFSSKGDDGHSPYIDEVTGTWWEWDPDKEEYHDTGLPARGESAFTMDIDNEMTSVPVSQEGKTERLITISFGLSCFYGSSVITPSCAITVTDPLPDGFSVNLTDASCPAVIIAEGTLLAELTELAFTAAHPSLGERKAVFSIAAVKSGGKGQDAIVQELAPSLSSLPFKRGDDGATLTPDMYSLKVQVKKTEGSAAMMQTIADSGLKVRYSTVATPSSASAGYEVKDSGIAIFASTAANAVYLAAFNAAGALVDRETVPITRDGIKGDKGDPLTYDELTDEQKEELRGASGDGVQVQYSPDKSTIHTTYQAGDKFMRTKLDSDTSWGAWIQIVGESGMPGEHTDYAFAYSSCLYVPSVTTPPSDVTAWHDTPPAAVSGKYLWVRVTPYKSNGSSLVAGTVTYARISGEKGDKGDKGEQGTPGADAASLHSSASSISFDGFMQSSSFYPSSTTGQLKTITFDILKGAASTGDAKITSVSVKVGSGSATSHTAAFSSNGIYVSGFSSSSLGVRPYSTSTAISRGITLTVTVSSASLNKSFTATISIALSARGETGLQGLSGPCVRTCGLWRSGITYYNNNQFIDVVLHEGKFYKLKSGVETSSSQSPSTNTSVWEIFSSFNALATSVLLASAGYIDVLGAASLFVGKNNNGVTHNADGTTTISTAATGWVMNQGEIYHTQDGKKGLRLTSDGCLQDPDGLHLLVSGKESDESNVMYKEIFADGMPYTTVYAASGVSGKMELADEVEGLFSPWEDRRGRIAVMRLLSNTATSNATLINASPYPSGDDRIQLTAGQTYTFSVWVKADDAILSPLSTSDVAEINMFTTATGTSRNTYQRVLLSSKCGQLGEWRRFSKTFSPSQDYYVSWVPLIHASENLAANPILAGSIGWGSFGGVSGITGRADVHESFGGLYSPWHKDGGRLLVMEVLDNSLSAKGSAWMGGGTKFQVTSGSTYVFSVWLKVQGDKQGIFLPPNAPICELAFYSSSSSSSHTSNVYVRLNNAIASVGGFTQYAVSVTATAGYAVWRPTFEVKAGMSGFFVAYAGARLQQGASLDAPSFLGMNYSGMSGAYVAYAGAVLEQAGAPSEMKPAQLLSLLQGAGVDIYGGSIVNKANRWQVQNLRGERTMWVDDRGVVTGSGVFVNSISTIDWANDVGRDKIIVLAYDNGNAVAYLGTDSVWRHVSTGAAYDGDTSDIQTYIDVLRCGDVLKIVNLPADCLGTSGTDYRYINLPYYIDSGMQDRGWTRYGALSSSIPRRMKADEMRMLTGKRIIMHLHQANISNTYAHLANLFYLDPTGTNVNLGYELENGIHRFKHPKVTTSGEEFSLPLNRNRVIIIECRACLFVGGEIPGTSTVVDSCSGYCWCSTSHESYAEGSGIDSTWT